MGTGRSNERKLPNGHRKGALDAELSMEANLSASTDRLMPYRRPSACPNCPLFPWLVVSSSNYFILYFCCREMKECYKFVVDAGKKIIKSFHSMKHYCIYQQYNGHTQLQVIILC